MPVRMPVKRDQANVLRHMRRSRSFWRMLALVSSFGGLLRLVYVGQSVWPGALVLVGTITLATWLDWSEPEA